MTTTGADADWRTSRPTTDDTAGDTADTDARDDDLASFGPASPRSDR